MLVTIRVTPSARREKVEKTARGFTIAVREDAQDNRANDRVREIVARELGVPISTVRMVKGHHSPVKTFAIETP